MGIALAITIFGFISSANAAKQTIDKIVAIVNDEVITSSDLNKAIAKKTDEKRKTSDIVFRREVLDNLIDETLFEQLVTKAKITISDDELARAIGNVLHQNRMTLPQLQKEVASKGITYDEYKDDVRGEIRRIKYVNQVIGPQVKISDQDLRDYYQRNQDKFRSSQKAHIAIIALSLAGLKSQEEFEVVREKALDISAKAKRGTSFTSLAKEYSQGPNAETGGDLGMVTMKDLPPVMSGTVKQLRIGDISNPFVSGNNVVIIKLISLPELSASDFDKLRDEIYSALYDERIDETLHNYLRRERQKAFVEVRASVRQPSKAEAKR
jgi:peptidyl-prolyl cis-trans isomerase SurA